MPKICARQTSSQNKYVRSTRDLQMEDVKSTDLKKCDWKMRFENGDGKIPADSFLNGIDQRICRCFFWVLACFDLELFDLRLFDFDFSEFKAWLFRNLLISERESMLPGQK